MDELKFYSYSEDMSDPRYVIFTLRREDLTNNNVLEEFFYIELCNWYMEHRFHKKCIYFTNHESGGLICKDCDKFNDILLKITYKFRDIQTLKHNEFDPNGCVGLANYDKYYALLDDDAASLDEDYDGSY